MGFWVKGIGFKALGCFGFRVWGYHDMGIS